MTTGKWLTAQFFDGWSNMTRSSVFQMGEFWLYMICALVVPWLMMVGHSLGHSCHVRYVDICAEVMVLMDRQVVDLPTGREHFGDV